MSIRALLAFLAALGVLFTSALAGATVASAATMHHDAQMAGMGHCSSQPGHKDGKVPLKSCCVAMCMAVAIAPTAPLRLLGPQHQASYSAVPQTWHGYLGEIATPPPRLA